MSTLVVACSLQMREDRSELNSLHRLDSQAVAAVYDRYFPDVYRYVRYRLGDETLAEDIVSDVFVRLLDAVQKRSGPVINLHSWLMGVANHLVTDHIRQRYRRPVERLPESLADGSPTLVEEVEQREHERSFRLALAQLTDEQQHVLALRFGQGYSLEETAAVMKKSLNAVKALQFRALAALHRKIGGRHE